MIISGYGTTGYVSSYQSGYYAAGNSAALTSASVDQRTSVQLSRVLQELERIESAFLSPSSGNVAEAKSVVSASPLAIETDARSTTLNSVEEVTRVGGAPNLFGAFDQSGAAGPGFDTGYVVTNGSFVINGESIAVAADDTIVDVLTAITNSAAQVTASYDVSTETIQLVHNEFGGDKQIVLHSDTSGFLDATKLSGAVATPGQFDETQQPLNTLGAFASVSSGAYFVNGSERQLDTATDTIQSVTQALTQSPVVASLTSDRKRLSITGDGGTKAVSLQSGSTGLFPAFHIEDGAYNVLVGENGISRKRSYRVADAFESIQKTLAEASSQTASGRALNAALMAIVDDTDTDLLNRLKRSGLDLRNPEQGLFNLTQDNRRRLTAALQKADSDVIGFLMGTAGKAGFIDSMRQAIVESYQGVGGVLNTYA